MEISKINVSPKIMVVEQDKIARVMSNKVQDSSREEDIKEKAKTDINYEELKSAVDKANTMFFKNNTHLRFEIHDKTKEIMVKIVRDDSGEVLKEIPPEKMLDMVAKVLETLGIIVDEKG